MEANANDDESVIDSLKLGLPNCESNPFYQLSNEVMELIVVRIRCSQDKQTFLQSSKVSRRLYWVSKEVARAFRSKIHPNMFIRKAHDCHCGPCGPDTVENFKTHFRSKCCFHEFLDDEYNLCYECCSSKCSRVFYENIDATYVTAVCHKFSFCCTSQESIDPLVGFLYGETDAGPTTQFQGLDLVSLTFSKAYFYPRHIVRPRAP